MEELLVAEGRKEGIKLSSRRVKAYSGWEGKCRFVKRPQGSLAVHGSVFKLRDPVAPSFVELHQ